MASALVILLQLLLVSLVAASHNFGGSVTYSFKGRNPNGTYRVSRHFIETISAMEFHAVLQSFHYCVCCLVMGA